jgi:CheY-like chemotaxis protein
LLQTLRQDPLARSIPILAFTSSKNPVTLNAAADLGVVAIFHKPDTYEDWKHAVHSICEWAVAAFVPQPDATSGQMRSSLDLAA